MFVAASPQSVPDRYPFGIHVASLDSEPSTLKYTYFPMIGRLVIPTSHSSQSVRVHLVCSGQQVKSEVSLSFVAL